jgi:hypothetical protein
MSNDELSRIWPELYARGLISIVGAPAKHEDFYKEAAKIARRNQHRKRSRERMARLRAAEQPNEQTIST